MGGAFTKYRILPSERGWVLVACLSEFRSVHIGEYECAGDAVDEALRREASYIERGSEPLSPALLALHRRSAGGEHGG